MAGWLIAMGVPSIAAFVLHAAGVGAFAEVASLTSAACTLPIVALAIIEGRRLRGGDPRVSVDHREPRPPPVAAPR
jgi:hypothetical protein